MRTRAAIFFGASWDATVSSPAKLRWSRNLKRDSRACRSTSKVARACCTGRSARSEIEAKRTADGTFCRPIEPDPLQSVSPALFAFDHFGRIGSWREDNIQRLEFIVSVHKSHRASKGTLLSS